MILKLHPRLYQFPGRLPPAAGIGDVPVAVRLGPGHRANARGSRDGGRASPVTDSNYGAALGAIGRQTSLASLYIPAFPPQPRNPSHHTLPIVGPKFDHPQY